MALDRQIFVTNESYVFKVVLGDCWLSCNFEKRGARSAILNLGSNFDAFEGLKKNWFVVLTSDRVLACYGVSSM